MPAPPSLLDQGGSGVIRRDVRGGSRYSICESERESGGKLGLAGNADAIKTALAERYREVLPADRFAVKINEAGISIEGQEESGRWRGGGMQFGFVELRLPLPTSLRLELFFKNRAEGLQHFASAVLGEPWPSDRATPHVRVTENEVRVWYGTGSEETADISFRPFSKAELGL